MRLASKCAGRRHPGASVTAAPAEIWRAAPPARSFRTTRARAKSNPMSGIIHSILESAHFSARNGAVSAPALRPPVSPVAVAPLSIGHGPAPGRPCRAEARRASGLAAPNQREQTLEACERRLATLRPPARRGQRARHSSGRASPCRLASLGRGSVASARFVCSARACRHAPRRLPLASQPERAAVDLIFMRFFNCSPCPRLALARQPSRAARSGPLACAHLRQWCASATRHSRRQMAAPVLERASRGGRGVARNSSPPRDLSGPQVGTQRRRRKRQQSFCQID